MFGIDNITSVFKGMQHKCLSSLCLFYLAHLGPEVIKLFSFSTQLSMKFILLINVKMPTIVGILTFISRINGSL